MTIPLRLGTDEHLLVRWHDVVRIHDHRHAARLLEDQRGLPVEELERVAEQLASGDLLLVRMHRPRPALLLPPPRVDEPAPPEPASPTVAVRPPTWLAIEVRHGSGVGYPRASFVLELPDGTERFEQLDDESRWRADDVAPGASCRIRFEPPLRLPLVEAREVREPTASDLPIALLDAGATPTCLATAASHLLVVPKPVAHAVRVADIHFGMSLAVVMPALPEGTPRGLPTPPWRTGRRCSSSIPRSLPCCSPTSAGLPDCGQWCARGASARWRAASDGRRRPWASTRRPAMATDASRCCSSTSTSCPTSPIRHQGSTSTDLRVIASSRCRRGHAFVWCGCSSAVRNFQWLRRLPITGQLDATTMTAVLDAARS